MSAPVPSPSPSPAAAVPSPTAIAAQIQDWQQILAAATTADEALFERLNKHLLSSTFLPASAAEVTAADVHAWKLVNAAVRASPSLLQQYAQIARWYRYVAANATDASITSAATAAVVNVPAVPAPTSNIFAIDIAAAAKEDAKLRAATPAPAAATAAATAAGGNKGEAKKPAAAAGANGASATAAPAAKGDEKKKKGDAAATSIAAPPAAAAAAAGAEKKGKEKAAKPAAAAAAASSSAKGGEIPQVYRLDLRVGEIKSAVVHPTEKHCYVCRIDVGAESGGERTVVAGLAEHFTPQQIVGKKIIVMVNIKAGDFKGVVSIHRYRCMRL